MSLGITLLSAAVGAFVFFKFFVYPVFISPLASVPAIHPLAKFTPWYILWLRVTHRENATVLAAHKHLGEVVRLGPNELSVNCVDDGIRTIYGKGFLKTSFYSVFEGMHTTNIFSSLEPRAHATKRKRIAHMYSKSYLLSSPAVTGLMRKLRSQLVPYLLNHAKSGASFDAMRLHKANSMDSVTAYFFGASNGTNHVRNEPARADWFHNFSTSRPIDTMIWRHEMPALEKFLQKFGIYLVPKSHKVAWDKIDKWCLSMCDGAERTLANPASYEGNPEEFPCVYHHLMSASAKEGLETNPCIHLNTMGAPEADEKWRQRSPQQLEVAAELLDQLVASHDTMSATLTYVYYELSRKPQAQKKLQEELLSLGNGVLHGSDEDFPASNKIDSLPYLHAVITEVLRLHPVVGGGQPRLTPLGQVTKIGQYPDIPGGVRVQSSALVLHQNPQVFPDPESFQPERWMPAADNEKRPGDSDRDRWFWAFGSGSRMCVGSNLAVLGK